MQATILVCCLIKPYAAQLAYVVVSADTDVYDLTEITKVGLLDHLVHVDADRLEAWKPNCPAVSKKKNFDHIKEIVSRAKFSENNDIVELLDSAQNVMGLNLPEDGFLIVRVPPLPGITSLSYFTS